ncbi:hypothetical protein GGI20_001816 [Coemansia sp. BCRC 34301]|nr:hypothetical protein GGI20_001816 [Coemansia sp. BCRC 34301]
MIFDMELDGDDGPLDKSVQSSLQLPSMTILRSDPRVASPRSGSPIHMRRKPSISAGVADMLEHQLDATYIDSDYEDMTCNVQVEVPIVDDFVNDCSASAPTHDSTLLPVDGSAALDGKLDEFMHSDDDGRSSKPAGCQPKASVDDFTVLRLIGKGGYGKVYLVQHKQTRGYYAMKVLRKASILLQRRLIDFTMTERSILSEVQHPFIVKLYYAFQSNSRLYLIMEYVAGGELFTHMIKERIFCEDQAVFYSAELVLALSHLHKLGIVFRDIKPENILLDKRGHLVLTDFGLSKTALGKDGRTNTFCGTPSYMAPEILNAAVSYDFSVDWWSLGILLYEMLTGGVPFKGKVPEKVAKNIAKTKVNYPPYMTPDARDLIVRLLRKKPEQRLGYGANGIDKIKKHRFFRKVDWERLEKDHDSLTPPIVPYLSGDGDYSNFDPEFTGEQLPPSVVRGSLVDFDPVSDQATLASDENACRIGRTDPAYKGVQGEEDMDPATAFIGFSYVATSVLDSVH